MLEIPQSNSIFPPINFLIQNSALLSSFAAQKVLSNGHPSSSSLAALEKLSKAFRRPDLQIEKFATSCIGKDKDQQKMSNVVPSRNRYGRPYISGRPLLTCDRQKIVECYNKGMKKIHIAKQLGITHSCVSKVLRRYAETGEIVAKACRTASCSCPAPPRSTMRDTVNIFRIIRLDCFSALITSFDTSHLHPESYTFRNLQNQKLRILKILPQQRQWINDDLHFWGLL